MHTQRHRRGHTLMELVAAMVASAFLARRPGLGHVSSPAKLPTRPTDAIRRSQAADIVSQICDELRYATLVIQQTPQILEFVVADRNADGTAEKIRYEWSGVAGDPLRKTINGGTAVDVLDFGQLVQRSRSSTSRKRPSSRRRPIRRSTLLLTMPASDELDRPRHRRQQSIMAQVINPDGIHLGAGQCHFLESDTSRFLRHAK